MRKTFSYFALTALFLLFQFTGLFAQGASCDPPSVTVPITTLNSATVSCFNPNFPTGYEVSYSMDGGMTWMTIPVGPGPNFEIDFLFPNQEYQTRARTICAPGDTSLYSDVTSFRTKDFNEACFPPRFGVTNVNMSSMSVFWSNQGSPNASNYIISYSTDRVNWTDATVPVTPQTYLISGLQPGTVYYVRIKSICDDGKLESEWSPFEEVRTLKDGENGCPNPDNLSVMDIQTDRATLVWSLSPSPNVIRYRVELLDENGQLVSQYISLPFETSHTFTNLTGGTIYNARVYSLCISSPNGDTTASEEATWIDFRTVKISTTCPTVGEFAINNITQNSAFIIWKPLDRAIGYIVEYSFDGGQTWQSQMTQQPGVTLQGLKPGTKYLVRIKTLCKEGFQSPPSRPRDFETKSFDDICPKPEFQLSVTDAGTLSIAIMPGNGGNGPWRWWINQMNMIVREGESNEPFFTISDLPTKGNYTICIQQTCMMKDTMIMSEARCKEFTFNTDPNKCAAPVNLAYHFNVNTPNTAIIKWGIPQPNNVTKYKLTIYAGNKMQTVETEKLEHVMKGLLKGMSYTVCVQSICQSTGGTTPTMSDTVCVTFVYGQDPSGCPSVTSTKIGNVTKNSADIYWADVPGAIGYIIEYSTDFQNWQSVEVGMNEQPALLTELKDNTKYYYRIITICKGGKSEPSRIGEFKTLGGGVSDCPKPQRLTVNRITATSGRAEWVYSNATPINGFAGYIQGEDGSLIEFSTDAAARNYVFNNLLPNTKYTVVLHAICIGKDGQTLNSDTVSTNFKTKEGQGQCPRPKELRATEITNNSAIITWVGSPAASSYIIRYMELPSGPVQTAQVPNPPFNLNGLNAGSKYAVSVVAVCKTSNGGTLTSDSTVVVFETAKVVNNCIAPKEVRVDSIGTTTAMVSWIGDVSSRNYEVWLLIGNTWTKVGDTQNTNFLLTDLVPGTQYQVKIRSGCRESQSDFSKTVRFTTKKKTCPSPTQVTVTNITATSATVTWTQVPGALNYTVTYFIDGNPNSLITITSGTNSTNLTNLTPDVMYIVRVRTRCQDQSLSEPTETDFRTGKKPVCQTPDSLSVSNITTNSAFIKWAAVPGALGYELLIRKDGDPNFTTITLATNQRTVDGLADNTVYIYKVRTICADNEKSSFSTDREFKTVQVCGVPQNVKATIINTFDATIVWDQVPGAIRYEVKAIIDGSPVTLTANTSTLLLTGLSPKATVIVQVRAICGEGNISPYSPSITFVTKGLPCAKPEGLSTISVTNNSAILTWSTVPNSVAYEVIVTGPNNYNQTQTVTGPPATFTGMTQSTTYTYKVRTLCADNEKSDFVTSTFTTTQFVCAQVTGVTVTSISQSGAIISWTTPAPGYQYEVSYSIDNGTTYTTMPLTANSNIQLASLPSATNILVRVKTICGANGSSDPVSTDFRTLEAGVCSTPTNLTVTNITVNSALASWDIVSGAISYQVSYKDVNASFFTTVNVTQNSRVLSNLVANTDYVVKVRARCAGGVNPFTEWTELKAFTTRSEANACGTPSIIDAVPTRNNATVSWTTVAGATSYRLSYSSNGGLTFVNLAWTPNTTQVISNLSPGKDYLVRVRAKCSNNTQSPFSSAFLFTTLASRMDQITNGEALTLTVYPNPTKGATTLGFDATVSSDVAIKLVDVTGREVFTQTFRAEVGKNEIPVEFNGYSSGVYQLQMIHNGATYHAKLIIQ